MQTVNIAELKTNLSAYIEQVKHGAEFIVKDRHRAVAQLIPLAANEDLDAEEETLVARGWLRLPQTAKDDDWIEFADEETEILMTDILRVIREERDED